MPLGKLQVGCYVPFTEEWIPFGHYHKGLIGGVLQWKILPTPQTNSGAPDQSPSPPIAQFGWAASFRKSLGGSKLLPFKTDGGHCVLGDLQCCKNVLIPFPDLCLDTILSVSSLSKQFLRPHGLVFAPTCTVNCGTISNKIVLVTWGE